MNNTKATIAICVLLVIAFVFYERARTREIDSALTALNQDRDSLTRQVKNLTRLLADARAREAAPVRNEPASPPVVAATPPTAERAQEMPLPPGVTATAPAGWSKNGSKPKAYIVGVDRVQTWNGEPSAYVKSVEPNVDGFGGMMQTSSAEQFHGKRIRLSGWAKTEDAREGGHLWLRVDGQQYGRSLQFDNMEGRAPKGTTMWQPYSIVLDVPPDATALAYGFFVKGTGQMWVSGTKIEEVGPDVPSTNMIKQRALPKTPTNLKFDPGS